MRSIYKVDWLVTVESDESLESADNYFCCPICKGRWVYTFYGDPEYEIGEIFRCLCCFSIFRLLGVENNEVATIELVRRGKR